MTSEEINYGSFHTAPGGANCYYGVVKIRVESYSGYRADQRPIKFWLGSTVHFVEAISDQWYGPDCLYFRLDADDGNTYVLSHKENTDDWTLESFRSSRSPSQFDPHLDPPSNVH